MLWTRHKEKWQRLCTLQQWKAFDSGEMHRVSKDSPIRRIFQFAYPRSLVDAKQGLRDYRRPVSALKVCPKGLWSLPSTPHGTICQRLPQMLPAD